ncbi:MAG: hypothetical protein AAGG75_06585 [Bacteroidota bacterium]
MKSAIIFRIFSLLLLCCLAFSCTKETMSEENLNDPNPAISEVPAIELLSVSTTQIIEHQDSIVFTIQYLDGDGDLGTSDPDATTVELVDNRDPDLLIFGYHLSPRTPEGTSLSIQGELSIVLNNSILLDDTNSSEQTTFSIRIQDRAGHWSNQVETATIIIEKE